MTHRPSSAREFVVAYAGEERRRVPIKGLVHRLLSFDEFVDLLAAQARGKWSASLSPTG